MKMNERVDLKKKRGERELTDKIENTKLVFYVVRNINRKISGCIIN